MSEIHVATPEEGEEIFMRAVERGESRFSLSMLAPFASHLWKKWKENNDY